MSLGRIYGSASYRLIEFCTKKFTKVELHFSRFCNIRKKIACGHVFKSWRLGQSSNKELWRPRRQVTRLTTTRWSQTWVYDNYDMYILRAVLRPVSGSFGGDVLHPHAYLTHSGFQDVQPVDDTAVSRCADHSRELRAGFEVLTIFGIAGQYSIRIPASLPSNVCRSAEVRVDNSGKSLWCQVAPELTGGSLNRRWFTQWCAEFSWVLFYYLFIKIKYKGKSYKWHRRNSSLVLRFGYSHLVALRIPDVFKARRPGKMKLVFFGTNKYEIRHFLAASIAWRPMNVYNGRGLRFARQLVFRKFGKVSAYR